MVFHNLESSGVIRLHCQGNLRASPYKSSAHPRQDPSPQQQLPRPRPLAPRHLVLRLRIRLAHSFPPREPSLASTAPTTRAPRASLPALDDRYLLRKQYHTYQSQASYCTRCEAVSLRDLLTRRVQILSSAAQMSECTRMAERASSTLSGNADAACVVAMSLPRSPSTPPSSAHPQLKADRQRPVRKQNYSQCSDDDAWADDDDRIEGVSKKLPTEEFQRAPGLLERKGRKSMSRIARIIIKTTHQSFTNRSNICLTVHRVPSYVPCI